jgi:hypothetical protein
MSYSETGHAQNAAKLHIVLTKITSVGTTYNPSNSDIKVSAVTTVSDNSDAAIANVDVANTPASNAIGAREAQFSQLSKLITRSVNALKATSATAKTIKDAVALEKKIQGTRATPKAKPTIPPPAVPIVYISASQMQFDSRIENTSKYILVVTADPAYIPNEPELTIAGLTTFLNLLKSTNTAVINTQATLSQARIARNRVLYLPVTGLYDIQTAIKKYVRSIPSLSELSKQLAKIKFTRPPKKDRPTE